MSHPAVRRVQSVLMTLMFCGGCATVPALAGPGVQLEKDGDRAIAVSVDGKPFTQYIFKNDAKIIKPICYPIIGPTGAGMTRNWPMKEDVAGEAHDHPHHTGLWFTHMRMNGVSFWHVGDDAGHTVHKRFVEIKSGAVGSLTAENDWVAPDGKVTLTDTRTLTFGKLDGDARYIDYDITLHASHGDVVIGDNKDGVMGIRTHPNLRLKNDPKRGVTTANGHAVNSEGQRDGDLWGKRAKWLDYWGDIDGKTTGIAIMDHPSNFRHPTWWHARDYGLISANAFGIHDFEKGKPAGTGDHTLKAGEDLRFRFRFVFHHGDAEAAKIGAVYEAWAK